MPGWFHVAREIEMFTPTSVWAGWLSCVLPRSLSLSLLHSLCAFFILMLFFPPTCLTEIDNLIYNIQINSRISDACMCSIRIVMWLSDMSWMTKVIKKKTDRMNHIFNEAVQPDLLSLSQQVYFWLPNLPMLDFFFYFLKWYI